MPKKPSFERVPLDVVKKVLEEQVQQEQTTELDRGIKKKEKLDQLQQLLLAESKLLGRHSQSLLFLVSQVGAVKSGVRDQVSHGTPPGNIGLSPAPLQ